MTGKITHYGVNDDGSLSVCRAKPENVGRYNCHHSEHRDMTPSQVESYYDGQAQLRRAMSRFIAKEAKTAAKSFNPRDVISRPIGSEVIIPWTGRGGNFTVDLRDANGNKLEDVPKFMSRHEAKAFVAGMSDSDKIFGSLTDDQKGTVLNLYDKGLSKFKKGVYHDDATPEFQEDTDSMFSYGYDGKHDAMAATVLNLYDKGLSKFKKGVYHDDATPEFQEDTDSMFSYGYDGKHDAMAAVQADYSTMYVNDGFEDQLDKNYWENKIENEVKGTEEQKQALLKKCMDCVEEVKKNGYPSKIPAVYQASIFTDLDLDKKSKEAMSKMGDQAEDLHKINFHTADGYDLEMRDPISSANIDVGGSTGYTTFASADDAKAYLLGAMKFQMIAPGKSTLDYNFQQVGMIEPTDRKAKFSYNGETHTLDDLQSLDGARVKFTYKNAEGEEHTTDSMIYYDPKNTRKGQILTVSMDGKGDVYKGDDGKPRFHWYKLDRMTTPIELLERRDSHDTGRNSLSRK